MRFATMSILVMTMGAGPAVVGAQSWQPPTESQRCPSKWGAGDQRGSGNHMKPETVLRATRLIRTGEVFELGQVLSESMPLPAGRRFEMFTKRSRQDPGSNRRGSNEELVVAEIGQVGTQFDTFSHQMIAEACTTASSSTRSRPGRDLPNSASKHVGALITRGVLIDVAALKGVEMLTDSYEITVAGSAAGAGAPETDATTWRRRHHSHRLGKAVGQRQRTLPGNQPRNWHRRRGMAGATGSDARGSDNGGVEVAPNPDRSLAGPIHQIDARRQRHPPARESQARRACSAAGERVRADRRATENPGRNRFQRRADSGSIAFR